MELSPASSVDVSRCSCRVRPGHRCHRPPHPRGAGRASGTGARPRRAGVGCWQENPDPGGMAREEHSTAWSPQGGSGLTAAAGSESSTGGSLGPSTWVSPARRLGRHEWGEHWILLQDQALPELDSLTVGCSKNCILQKLDPLSA